MACSRLTLGRMIPRQSRRRAIREVEVGFNAAFDDVPHAYDELRSTGYMARRRADSYDRVVAGSTGMVLELGCGTGTLLRELAARHPDREFLGVEPLGRYVEFARSRAEAQGLHNVRFEEGTGEELVTVAGRGSAGLVISVDTLHHVRDMGRVARQVRQVATEAGRWRAMEPNRVHPYVWLYHTLTRGERTFPVGAFLHTVNGAGWRLAGRETLFLFPSGVSTVPAWVQRIERRAEKLLPLAGAVAFDLVRSS
jgi:SAM-dependent methyltransferase